MTARHDRPRPFWVNAVSLSLALVVFVTLIALGIWQSQRLSWKLDLIEAVESRAFGQAVAPPSGAVTAEDHAYLRVIVTGAFRHDLTKRVKAITELGPGHWIMTPLQSAKGYVWVNRGFSPNGTDLVALSNMAEPLRVEGLLRITEPGGTLLEKNDPSRNRWVSRDIAAMSKEAGLSGAFGYFIDADHMGPAEAWPRGGLTKLNFRNPHLSYAITWYTMAALFLGGVLYVVFKRP